MVLGSREAYLNLTKLASSIDIDEWKRGEQQAQKNQVKDVQSMDYFALCIDQGMLI